MEQNEERATHVVYEKDEHGQIVIADEVVAIIAGIAATEVKGVDSMYGCWMSTSASPVWSMLRTSESDPVAEGR